MSLAAAPANPYSLSLTIGRNAALVELAGDIDLQAAPDLTRLMHSLDLLAYMPVDVDLSRVTFLDSFGVRALVAATLRRERDHLPPVRIGQCSPAALFYLDMSGLDADPTSTRTHRIGLLNTPPSSVSPLWRKTTSKRSLSRSPPALGQGPPLPTAQLTG